MEEVEKKEEELIPYQVFNDPLYVLTCQLGSIEETIGIIGRSLMRKLDKFNSNSERLIRLLENTNIPSDAFMFDEIFAKTGAIPAGGSLAVGTYTIPSNMSGIIQQIGFSLPTPITSGNTIYKLLINNAPIRGWTWTHNPSLTTTGLGKGLIDDPVIVRISITGGDILSFVISASVAEASTSYAFRVKGWLK